MFCGCATAFGARRTRRPARCAWACPAALPVLNRRAVELGIRAALALGCRVNRQNRFARKHYFYPDLPKDYQISQYEEPLAEHGALEIVVGGVTRRIGVERLHLEEDAGKITPRGDLATARSTRSTSTAPACR